MMVPRSNMKVSKRRRLSWLVVAAIAAVAMPAMSLMAQERVPTPAEDNQMLHAFRAMTLKELGLTTDYENYQKANISVPKQTGITSDEDKKRWIFALAIQRVQLEWMGSANTTTSSAATGAKAGLRVVLGRIFRTLTPGQLDAVSRRWTPPVTGSTNQGVDPKTADQTAADGEAAARAVLREYLSAEKAAAYDSASMLQQADLLLEAGEAVITARTWPSAYILTLTDTSGGYSGREVFVKRLLGTNSPEYQKWPSMTDRQRAPL